MDLSLCLLLVLLLLTGTAFAASKDLGEGFTDHGVATPVSNHRGTVATQDGAGRDVVLTWIMDCRGVYALLMIDAQTGKAEQFAVPFNWGGDSPFASVLSSQNRFYSHYGSHFVEFDPVQRKFTFFKQTVPQMAMSMTEDDKGVIWSATYPNSGVASYNPKTGEFRDYGHLYKQNWAQYPRYLAADDTGWIYFGIGSTSGQIIALDPVSGQATPLIPEAERVQGAAAVYRDLNGKVYGQDGGNPGKWMELYQGRRTDLDKAPTLHKKPIIADSQSLFYQQFPSGKRLVACDLLSRKLTVEDPQTKARQTVDFDYTSEGAHIMGVCAAPNDTMCGGTAFPMRYFGYNPATDEWDRHNGLCQWNTVTRQGDRFFVGGYGHGVLLEWDPTKPWVDPVKGKADCNPLYVADTHPDINRPHELLACPDGKTIILAGTPGYGYTGGGLFIWDREARQGTLLKHTDLLPQQSTMSLAPLPGGKLLGGSTVAAGTGGEVKAKEAELYVLDLATKQLEWHEVVFPGVQNYTDLCTAPDGLVYGVADGVRFFVFDPKTRKVIHEENTKDALGGTSGGQGPRVFVIGPDKTVYMLFGKSVVTVTPGTFKLTVVATSPVPIAVGGDYLQGRIYFASGSHLYSWRVPTR